MPEGKAGAPTALGKEVCSSTEKEKKNLTGKIQKNNFRKKVKVTAGPTLFKYGMPQ